MAAQDAYTPLGGIAAIQHISVAVTAAQAGTADAVLASLTVPAGCVVTDVVLTVTDMDTGVAGLVDVGDSGNDARFISDFSIQAAGTTRYADTDGSAVVKYASDTDIEVTISTAAATGVAGTVDLTVVYAVEG